MTAFTIKLIAIIAMIIDHVGAYFQLSGSDIISFQHSFYMRCIGRLALPIFAFFLVEGYLNTKNLKKYIDRLHLFALISQIPFAFLFSKDNYMLDYQEINKISFSYNFELLIFIFSVIFVYWKYICDKKFNKSIILMILAYLIVPLKFNYNGYILLSANNLNIMYEFGISLILLKLISIIKYSFTTEKVEIAILPLILFSITIYYTGMIANYNYTALLLIIFIFLLKDYHLLQKLFIILWSVFVYEGNIELIIFVIISVLLINMYNKKRGREVKYLFYIFYPLHIIIISFIKILI